MWALNVMAYEMITGAHPFSGAGTGGWRAVEKRHRPSSPGELLGGLREVLADLGRPV